MGGLEGPRCFEDRDKRIRAALNALVRLLGSLEFGAKKTRFLPHAEVESLVALVIDPLRLNALPGHRRDYIARTVELAESLQKRFPETTVAIHYYADDESPVEKPAEAEKGRLAVKRHSNHVEALVAAAQQAEELGKARCP